VISALRPEGRPIALSFDVEGNMKLTLKRRAAAPSPFAPRGAFAVVAAGVLAAAGLSASPARADDTPAVEVQQPAPAAAPVAPAAADATTSRPPYLEDWPEGTAAPAGYHWTQRPRLGPIIAGATVLGVLWGVSALVGAAAFDDTHDPAYEWLYVPVAGPFLELTNTTSAAGSVTLVIDGVGQAAGAALLIWGLTSPITRVVRNDVSKPLVLPMPVVMGRGGAGLGVVGTF
jgi:hypothetical protein